MNRATAATLRSSAGQFLEQAQVGEHFFEGNLPANFGEVDPIDVLRRRLYGGSGCGDRFPSELCSWLRPAAFVVLWTTEWSGASEAGTDSEG